MTPYVIAIIITAPVLYAIVSTLIFAIRHGQLKDIVSNQYFRRQYRKRALLTETAWGAGFLALLLLFVVSDLLTSRYEQALAVAFTSLVGMIMYVMVRLVRVYVVALEGVAPLMQRFGIYRRSSTPIFCPEMTMPLEKVSVPAAGLDTDFDD